MVVMMGRMIRLVEDHGIGSFVKTKQGTVNTGYKQKLGSWDGGDKITTFKYNNKKVEFTKGNIDLYMHCGFASNNCCDISDSYTNYKLGNYSISDIPYTPHTMPAITNTRSSGPYWTTKGDARSIGVNWSGDNHYKEIKITLLNITTGKDNRITNYTSYDSTFFSNTSWVNTGSTSKTGVSTIGSFYPNMGHDLRYNIRIAIRDVSNTSFTNKDAHARLGLRGIPPLDTYSTSITPISEVGQNNCKIGVGVGSFNQDDSSRVSLWANISDGAITNNIHVDSGLDIYNYTSHWSSKNYNPTSQSSWFTARCYAINEQDTRLYTTRTLYSYTYTAPSISYMNITSSNYSPQDNPILVMNLKGRRWNLESNISHKLAISNSSYATAQDISNWFVFNTSQLGYVNTTSSADAGKAGYGYSNIGKSLGSDTNIGINKIYNADMRSRAYISSTFTLTSSHPDMVGSTKSVSKSKTVRIQLQPTKVASVTGVTSYPDGTDVQGQTVKISEVNEIQVTLTYPSNVGAAGVLSGYKLEVIDSAGVIAHIAYATSAGLTVPTSYRFNTETDLTLGKMNYVRVTPYYLKANSDTPYAKRDESNIILGLEETDLIQLVKPVDKAGAPVIDYPINNTTWHNKDFRLMVTLSEDPNYEDLTPEQKQNYEYTNMQVEIITADNTKAIYNYSNTYVSVPKVYSDCFSSTLKGHRSKKMIWLNKVSDDVLTSTQYRMRVRVQVGNYNGMYTEADMRDDSDDGITWSEWSDQIILNVQPKEKYNLPKGSKIFAVQYQNLRTVLQNLRKCYPLGADTSVNVLTGEYIKRNEYTKIYETLVNWVNSINEYCTFDNDRQYVKVAYDTKQLPDFEALQEIVLSADTGVDDNGNTGRNYINILMGYIINCLK